MHTLGYVIFAAEVVALALLSQLWMGIRVQHFLRHFASEADRATELGVTAPRTDAAHPQRLAA